MNPTETRSGVESPCVQTCVLGPAGHCVGCGRTSAEIGNWVSADDERKREIKKRSAARLCGVTDSPKR